ncbi:MAG: amidohydrolase family protein [Betaproteobacteria bacterium]|jgi:predicted amidohydrolase YtcJ|nr:amidohydrolase family protein [Betaproteobacteria bacterium]
MLKICSAMKLVLMMSIVLFFVGAYSSESKAQLTAYCDGLNDIIYRNGNIITVDENKPIVSSIRIQGDRIVAVGEQSDMGGATACTETVDLEGRTVIPGLINSHLHFIRHASRAGYAYRDYLKVFNIPDLQKSLAERAKEVPEGSFITLFGGWTPVQFAEKRLPNLEELTLALPNHPVFLMTYPWGPAATNHLGKVFFESIGVPVAEDGSIKHEDKNAANSALVELQTEEDLIRSTQEAMNYAVSLGLTNVLDMGGLLPWAGMFDEKRGYDTLLQLWREKNMNLRVRIVPQNTDQGEFPVALKGRLDFAFRDFGDDKLKVIGVGEDIVNRESGEHLLQNAYELIAEQEWLVQQHSMTAEENEFHAATMEKVNAKSPVANLHWSIAHVLYATDDFLSRLKSMGVGVTVQSLFYIEDIPFEPGPPYRKILDSGVKVGGGTDGQPISPWTSMYHMTTGLSSTGNDMLSDQRITREEALQIYTKGSAWFTMDDEDLGSLEVGKLADLVVLTENILTVPDDDFRDLKSVLTVVGGEVVYSDGSLVNCENASIKGDWYKGVNGSKCIHQLAH